MARSRRKKGFTVRRGSSGTKQASPRGAVNQIRKGGGTSPSASSATSRNKGNKVKS